MTLVSATTVLVSDGPALYTVNLATRAVAPLPFTQQETRAYAHIEAARDRASVYMVQSSVYRLAWPELTLMNEYVASSPMGATEAADGLSLFITQPNSILQVNQNLETFIATIPYPEGLTSVQASPCAHVAYPNTLFVAGRAATATFGFRRYNTLTKAWTTITLDIPAVKCAFTPDGNYVILSSTSTGAWLYSMVDGSMAKPVTAQINGVLVDPSQSYILLAKQATGLIHLPITIQDSRTCGPGQFSDVPGLASPAQCQTCPAGSLCPGGSNISQCAPGSYSAATGLRSQGQCSACPKGHYCTGGAALSLCPLGSYSLASSVTAATDCSRCLAGFYCPNTTVIVACPSNTNSPPGSSDLASCTCNAGYKCTVTKVVHAEITLPVTVQDFEALRAAYILAVAAAAGVDPSQVVIVSVTSAAAGGRRLLAVGHGYTEVHTSIYGSSYVSQPHMAIATLDTHLVKNGLPMQGRDPRVTLHKEISHAIKTK
jgi:hypothetical protein